MKLCSKECLMFKGYEKVSSNKFNQMNNLNFPYKLMMIVEEIGLPQ